MGLRVTAACAALLALLACAPAGHAAQALSISPPTINLTAEAGETVTAEITVRAPDEAVTVELVHLDVGFDAETYQTRLIRDDAPETTSFSTRGWFSLPTDRARIPAGSSRVLSLRVTVPSNTPGGTYVGAAILRPVITPDAAQGGRIRAVGQTGPIVFIAVTGGEPPKPTLRSFELPRVVSSGPLRPRVMVGNDGDDFFTFSGTLMLDGNDADAVRIERQYVVPELPRLARTSAGSTGAAGRLQLGDGSLGIGRHEVELRLRTEPTGKTLVARQTVWVVPIWLRLTLIVLLLALLAGGVVLLRRVRAWRLARLEALLAAEQPAPADEAYDEELDAELDADFEPADVDDAELADDYEDSLDAVDPYDLDEYEEDEDGGEDDSDEELR